LLGLFFWKRGGAIEFKLFYPSIDFQEQELPECAFIVTKTVSDVPPEWKLQPDMGFFLSNYGLAANIYISSKKNSCVIAIEDGHSKDEYFKVLSLLPRMYENFFKDFPPDKSELKVLKLLLESKTGEKTTKLLSELEVLAQNCGIAQIIEENLERLGVESFLKSATRGLVAAKKDKLKEMERFLIDIEKDYKRQLREIDAMRGEVFVAENKQGVLSSVHDIWEYIAKRPFLTISYDVNTDTLMIYIKTTLANFNPDIYRSGKHHGVFSDRQILLLDEILINESATLNLESCWKLTMSGDTLMCREVCISHTGSEVVKHMPNVHLSEYGCLGDYKPILERKLNEFDIPGIIDILIATTQTWNLSDGPVTSKFLHHIFNTYKDRPIFEYKGEPKSPDEILKILSPELEQSPASADEPFELPAGLDPTLPGFLF
jgi:hypothetical protein